MIGRLARFGGQVTIARIAAGLTVCLAIGVMTRSFWPRPMWNPPEITPSGAREESPHPMIFEPIEAFAVLWQRDLRQPLNDPPPVAQAAPAQFTVQLVGTLADLTQPVAVFGLADGRTIARRVGEQVDRYTLAEIGRGRAVLTGEAGPIELRVAWYDRILADAEATRERR